MTCRKRAHARKDSKAKAHGAPSQSRRRPAMRDIAPFRAAAVGRHAAPVLSVYAGPMAVALDFDGVLVDSEPELVRALAAELTDVIATAAPTHRAEFERGCLDAASRAETEAGLLRYSRAIRDAVPSAEMATREAAFRNGWFVRVGGEKAQPLHAEWLRRAGVDVEALARVSIE